MQQPLVSVVMTIYNGEQYLKEAISSVVKQSYKNLEIIVIVEAGTTDNSLDILRQFKDNRIRTAVNKNRLGLSDSLNKGLEMAKGKYIARLDDDDVCAPDRFEKQVKLMERYPQIGMCGTNGYIIDKNGYITDITELPCKPIILKMLLYIGNYFLSSSVMIRREVIRKYHLCYSGNVSEDYLLWSQIAAKTSICNIPEYLVAYRISEGNRSNHLMQEQECRDKEIQHLLWQNAGVNNNLTHSFTYHVRGQKNIALREQMIKNLYCCSSDFCHMKLSDFYIVMMIFYREINKGFYRAFEDYWITTTNLYGKYPGWSKQIYVARHCIYNQRRKLFRKMKIGKEFKPYGQIK